MRAYVHSHSSIQTFHLSISPSSFHLPIYLSTLIYFSIHPSTYTWIHRYNHSSRHSSIPTIHPQSHSFINQSIPFPMDPFIFSINSSAHPTSLSIYPVTDNSENENFRRIGNCLLLRVCCILIPFPSHQEKTIVFHETIRRSMSP